MVIIVPVIILTSWKPLIDKVGGAFVLSTSITIGLISIGLMGYSNAIARDRDKGIFQRLRVAPVSSWCIMASRLIVQLLTITLLTLLVFVIGYDFDHVKLSISGYVLTFISAIASGAVYLSMGQVIVGRIKNPETVQSTTRLVYLSFIMVGMFGQLGVLGDQIKQIVHYSPYGTVNAILASSMEPSKWTNESTMLLLLTLGYTLVFSFLGIKWFKWK